MNIGCHSVVSLSAGVALFFGSCFLDTLLAEGMTARKKHEWLVLGRHKKLVAHRTRVLHDLLPQTLGRAFLHAGFGR